MQETAVSNTWEYKTTGWDAHGDLYHKVGDKINNECDNGWEFICGNLVGNGSNWYYSATFRRPKQNLQD